MIHKYSFLFNKYIFKYKHNSFYLKNTVVNSIVYVYFVYTQIEMIIYKLTENYFHVLF